MPPILRGHRRVRRRIARLEPHLSRQDEAHLLRYDSLRNRIRHAYLLHLQNTPHSTFDQGGLWRESFIRRHLPLARYPLRLVPLRRQSGVRRRRLISIQEPSNYSDAVAPLSPQSDMVLNNSHRVASLQSLPEPRSHSNYAVPPLLPQGDIVLDDFEPVRPQDSMVLNNLEPIINFPSLQEERNHNDGILMRSLQSSQGAPNDWTSTDPVSPLRPSGGMVLNNGLRIRSLQSLQEPRNNGNNSDAVPPIRPPDGTVLNNLEPIINFPSLEEERNHNDGILMRSLQFFQGTHNNRTNSDAVSPLHPQRGMVLNNGLRIRSLQSLQEPPNVRNNNDGDAQQQAVDADIRTQHHLHSRSNCSG